MNTHNAAHAQNKPRFDRSFVQGLPDPVEAIDISKLGPSAQSHLVKLRTAASGAGVPPEIALNTHSGKMDPGGLLPHLLLDRVGLA